MTSKDTSEISILLGATEDKIEEADKAATRILQEHKDLYPLIEWICYIAYAKLDIETKNIAIYLNKHPDIVAVKLTLTENYVQNLVHWIAVGPRNESDLMKSTHEKWDQIWKKAEKDQKEIGTCYPKNLQEGLKGRKYVDLGEGKTAVGNDNLPEAIPKGPLKIRYS